MIIHFYLHFYLLIFITQAIISNESKNSNTLLSFDGHFKNTIYVLSAIHVFHKNFRFNSFRKGIELNYKKIHYLYYAWKKVQVNE